MKTQKLLYLSKKDVEKVDLPMKEIIEALDEAFKEKGLGKIEMPPKPGIHTMPDAFIHAMPAYIPSLGSAGMKWVSGYPENYKRNLPYITGLLVLNDPETGIPISVMDCIWITAMRTGAATAVAGKYMANMESNTVGILGCGVQGRTNLIALNIMMPELKDVKAYDISEDAATRYAEEMGKDTGLDIRIVGSPEEAVEDSDIIITAGPILKVPNPAIEGDWLKPGVFASPVDFDSYFKKSAFEGCDKFVTDDREQCLYYKSLGYFQHISEIYADLGEIAASKKPGRENKTEKIICANLGLAMDDMATAIKIYKKAIENNIGTWLEL
ncbi:MAG: ornithine cyclodeaminase family protein [Desulfobacteraceae bacterium]|nr:MAG: ornithine cyclodeaminase family protein [Desulfobacteraceae bacterium]